LDDWNFFIKDSILKELQEINSETPIDLVLLTGDLIDKGGAEFKTAKEAFVKFKDNVILPITSTLNLPIERFLIIPGNHDLDQKVEPIYVDLGLRTYFDKAETVNDFIKKGKSGTYNGFERVKQFKEFETELYNGVSDCQLSPFDSSFKLNIRKQKVGISCLNSSWRCYDSKADKGLILIGDNQIANSFNYIKDCEVKIALVHHPYDWISEIEKKTIHGHLHTNYDLMFIGHVHEGETIVTTDYAGSLFVNVAPGALTDIRSDSRKFSNGFTIVDYKTEEKSVQCTYKRFNHPTKKFVLNTDLGEGGVNTFEIPQTRRLKQIRTAQDHLKTITDARYEEMNEHLISTGADFGPKNIKDAFVLPTIKQDLIDGKKENGVPEGIALQDIIKSDNDLLFFATKESGKTMLLFRLIQEYVERFEFTKIVPVYIDFLDIGNREIESCIRSYLACGTEDLKVLLENRDIVLLIDNIHWNESEFHNQIKKLREFKKEYQATKRKKCIKIISTGLTEIVGVIPSDFDLPGFDFNIYFIESLHTSQIKALITKWVPTKDSNDLENRLEKIVENFKSFALPRNAMSVTLFLWSMENKDRKPINNATLLDIFLEIVLEKMHGDEIYRERFDIQNKLMLLAHIASKMLERNQPNYSLPYSELVKIVEDYLHEVGFDFDAQKLVDYFIKRKIFVKFSRNNTKFRYSCFFHFFLAKRMIYNEDFRSSVFGEEAYHNFVNEIDYYTGLARSDKKTLKLIHSRLVKEFEPYQQVLSHVNIDTHFNVERPAIKGASIKRIKSSKPTQEQFEKQIDEFLEHLPNPEVILKKEQRKSLETVLVLMTNVLRNSEGVEDLKLKKKAYEDIIRNTLIFILLYQFVIIEYYNKFNSLPPNIPKDYDLKAFLRNIPFHIQLGMTNHLGTIKLAPVILDKIKNDTLGKSITGTDIEKFLSVFLYADIQGHDYHKYLKAFVKTVKNNVVMDYCFFKLMHYYYTRSKIDSSNDQVFLDIISTLKIRTEGLPKRMRDTIMKAISKERYEDSN
jgi:predicted MPP superfamily phosphohydrolase